MLTKMFCVVLCLALLIVTSVAAEVAEEPLAKAGNHLKTYQSRFYIGFWISLGGSVISSLGSLMLAYDPGVGLLIALIGSGTSLTGSIIQLLAVSEIGQAGDQLIEASGG